MRVPAAVAALALCAAAAPPSAPPPAILPLRAQAALIDAELKLRLDTIVPKLMRQHGIDMWVLIAREYGEDPVVSTMLDARSMHARRTTILIFHDPGDGRPVERLTVSRYGLAGLFAPAWDPAKEPDQYARAAALIAERKPNRIALNVSPATAFADGLTHSQYEALTARLPASLRARIVPAEPLAVGWLETRSAGELARYPGIVAVAHRIIADGYAQVRPGITTADDLVWWQRERVRALGLDTWFHPSVAIFRKGVAEPLEGDAVIRPGDMLWTDFGITYLRLNTDTQQLAYVLRPGETDAPAGLKAGLAAANRVQDALTATFRTGRTGNEMLVEARATAIAAGLKPTIYSHPLGYHGHAAGAAIGFWDDQTPSPRGDHPLAPDTGWSIELKADMAVPEWGEQTVPFRLEEDGWFDGRTFRWLDGRQTRFHLIATPR
ncbi:M24 family metallopeptidase [Sphingomonas jatrophae]|uniref:Xaa-Pro aminopeptidase n=1 Tax=Sphingomonas jatrophae TaxID=1166337 RepID=A0A1I6LE33_9SPHN|nr:M24 family metallopeptidase [Sphingomonas jatrophae]SFS01530.1 Xaa-Pro aminopeptidase [Sphingomonas jatrophae]